MKNVIDQKVQSADDQLSSTLPEGTLAGIGIKETVRIFSKNVDTDKICHPIEVQMFQ